MKRRGWSLAVRLTGMAAWLAGASVAQEQTPEALLSEVCEGDELGLFSCGSDNRYRGLAQNLAGLGKSAMPAIEGKLSEVERIGAWKACSGNEYWIVAAYAKIGGRDALPRIRQMLANPQVGWQAPPRNALSLAMGLTSYVSDKGLPVPNVRCNRAASEPRDALDAVMTGWLKGDQKWLTANLGPAAQASLNKLLKGWSWERLRAELAPSGTKGEVGYKFDIPGTWSEPGEPLEAAKSATGPIAELPAPEIETIFVDREGHRCGGKKVRFLATENHRWPWHKFLVDCADLEPLLRVISECAASGGA